MGNEDPVSETGQVLEGDGGISGKPLAEDLRNLADGYLGRYFHFGSLLGIGNDEKRSGQKEKPVVSAGFKAFILFLKITPWLCLAGYILSFFWDLQDAVSPIYFLGREIRFDNLIRILAVSGLIGYATNYIAIKMLFKPVQKRPIFGQGLIPAQREIILDQLAKGIHDFILNPELIRKRVSDSAIIPAINSHFVEGTHGLLSDADFRNEVKRIILDHLSRFLARDEVRNTITGEIDARLEANIGGGLKGFLFRAYRKVGRNEYEQLRENIVLSIPGMVNEALQSLENNTPQVTDWLRSRSPEMETFITDLVFDILSRIDIRELLFRQMEYFDEQRLEKMVWSATSDQLVYIQLLGTILGILGGLLIWEPVAMTIFLGGGFLFLWVLDVLLFRLTRKSA